jgi:hypothetical protein
VSEGRSIAILYTNGHEILVTPAQGALAGFLAGLMGALLARWASPAGKPVVRSADGAVVLTLPQKYRVQLRQLPAAAAETTDHGAR